MFKKSITGLFTALAIAGFASGAMAEQDAALQAPVTAPARHTTALTVGGPALPGVIAGRLLAADQWAPIAAGEDSTSHDQLVVLRKEGTDLVRLATVGKGGAVKLLAEGPAQYFKKPSGPLVSISANGSGLSAFPDASRVQASENAPGRDGNFCFPNDAARDARLIGRIGETSIIKFVGTDGAVYDLYAGTAHANIWTLVKSDSVTAEESCMLSVGGHFKTSTNYPYANPIQPPTPPMVSAPPTDGAPVVPATPAPPVQPT